MRIEPIAIPKDGAAAEIDLSVDSIALQRLIAEVRRGDDTGAFDTTAYNRSYHRHNR